jgi:formylglycine-generating enzyme required for sulfatase activity
MDTNPSEFRGEESLPVDSVSWDDAQKFCTRLSQATGRVIRLPSEAEWEYACRAGTTTEFFFGDSEADLDDYAWFNWNSDGRTHPVGTKAANSWGLHDMTGNVWEWCEDIWHSDYEGAPADGRAWQDRAEVQPRRCLRGGA